MAYDLAFWIGSICALSLAFCLRVGAKDGTYKVDIKMACHSQKRACIVNYIVVHIIVWNSLLVTILLSMCIV